VERQGSGHVVILAEDPVPAFCADGALVTNEVVWDGEDDGNDGTTG
jgi:hypothetical protein